VSPIRIRYHYSTMLILAGLLVCILVWALATHQWALAGLAVLTIVLLSLHVPKARRQRSSRT
jgi:prepilin signal peptidase PulO-like enzyme (type II secretory pathway)